jgi:hypothetical protein
MRAARLTWLAGMCALACSGSAFRGGYARSEAPLRGGKALLSFIPGHCEDAQHVEHAPRFSGVDLVETETGRLLLFEHRQGHDLLVAENFHGEGSFWVFEVVLSGNHLRRWRIPRSPSGTGSIEMGRELKEVARGERFEADLASRRANCSLVPKASSLAREN